MGLLKEIQTSLMNGEEISPILLKLRYLASRLGSSPLEEWVKHESEGYPRDADLPEYRQLPVTYRADFSGPFGSGVKNATIPPHLIKQFAGDHWAKYEMRQSVSGIERLTSGDKDEGVLYVNSSDLVLLLQGKVFPGYNCVAAQGLISTASLVEIQNAVRARILDLTLAIENSLPSSLEIDINAPQVMPSVAQAATVNNITNQTIYGNMTTVSNSGDSANLTLTISASNIGDVREALIKGGISPEDAEEFSQIIRAERPENDDQPFGVKAKSWIAKNISKAVDGTWKASLSVATTLLTEAAKRYYGLDAPT